MLRMMIDVAADATITTEIPAGTSLSQLGDRNPGNPVTGVSAALKVCVDLGSSGMVPVNCLAIFGLSPEMIGGTVGVQRQTSTPIAGHWGVGTYTADISSDRLWLPFDEEGWDVANDAYFRYWMVTITPPDSATGSVGEVCLGLTKTPGLNYHYGRTHAQAAPVTVHETLGGVRFAYQRSKIARNSLSLQWAGSPDEQQLANMTYFWQDTERGLYPFVLIPDDSDRMEGCYYVAMPPGLSNTEDFLNTFSYGLDLTEVVAYESA